MDYIGRIARFCERNNNPWPNCWDAPIEGKIISQKENHAGIVLWIKKENGEVINANIHSVTILAR